ncbi:hypothetical protein LIER_20549 [Lithospermum erythrorhizon]|uniref:Uncharacterized protein n=1 Tax=Lithospermum erythrorhizon TaxID=34254 RepID=A0AAV3QLU7_LITER
MNDDPSTTQPTRQEAPTPSVGKVEVPRRSPQYHREVNGISRGRSRGGDLGSAKRVYAKRDVYAVTAGACPEFPNMANIGGHWDESGVDSASLHTLGGVHGRCGEPVGSGQPHGHHEKTPAEATKMVEFTIVYMSEEAYNGIIGRSTLSQFEVVVSLVHLKMKFPTRCRTGEIQGSQKKARGCYLASTKHIKA